MANDYFATLDSNSELMHCLVSGINEIPEGSVPVDKKTWMLLTQDRLCIWRYEGKKFVKYPAPPLELDTEALSSIERLWRDEKLRETDQVVTRHRDEIELSTETTLTSGQYQELQTYRAFLRKWPESGEFPDKSHRPAAPTWLESQMRWSISH
ncbi:phage tail assembly chaperone [Pseudomonas sp. Eqa60]|uniref:phage tail assembly chaperone n=1 Tax=Pseudomonas sp. Eqa60 TaxID=2799184 RepID=UPI001FD5EAE2|nr:phage tail assembly chaperone [Pseudomonas sp. Eqa60]